MAQIENLKTGHKFKKTEAGEIPVEWEVASLGDISTEIYRYPTYYNIQYVEKGTPEIRGELIKPAGTLETDMSLYRFISKETAAQFPRTRMQEGDFVISVRGTMGKVAIVPKELDGANMTANLMRISPDRNRVYLLWLHQVFMSDRFQEQLSKSSSSTTIKTIKAPELKSLMFAIPSFLEQKKIAEILLTVDNAIEKTAQLIEKKKELKKGLMQDLLTHGIGHKKFKKTKIGEAPEGWEIDQLKKIGKIITGSTPSTKIKEYFNGEYMFVTPFDMGDFKYVEKTARMLSEEGISVSRRLPKDTVMVTCIASIGKMGMAAEECSTNQQINSIICNKNVDSHFIYYMILHKVNFLKTLAGQTAVPIVKKSLFENVFILLPPFHEQKRIAEILSSVDAEIEKEVAEKEKFEQMKKGLMQVLLTGKVRVRI